MLFLVSCSSVSNALEENLFMMEQTSSLRYTFMDKRSCFHKFSRRGFEKMVPLEVDTFGSHLAVCNLKCFVKFRAQEIQKELDLGCSWKTWLTKLWYKTLGKSLPWQLACAELKASLWGQIDFLKSSEGWGEEYEEKMKQLLKQPY